MDCKPTNMGQKEQTRKRRQFSWWWILHSTQRTLCEMECIESILLLTWQKITCLCWTDYRKETFLHRHLQRIQVCFGIFRHEGCFALSIPVSFYVDNDSKKVWRYSPLQSKRVTTWICNQYYARLNIQSRADEATHRTYGKRKQMAVNYFLLLGSSNLINEQSIPSCPSHIPFSPSASPTPPPSSEIFRSLFWWLTCLFLLSGSTGAVELPSITAHHSGGSASGWRTSCTAFLLLAQVRIGSDLRVKAAKHQDRHWTMSRIASTIPVL